MSQEIVQTTPTSPVPMRMHAFRLSAGIAIAACYAVAADEVRDPVPFPFQSMRLRKTPVAADVKNLAEWKGDWQGLARQGTPHSSRLHVAITLHDSGKLLALRLSRSDGHDQNAPVELIAIPVVQNGSDLYFWVTPRTETSNGNDPSDYATSGVIVKYARDNDGSLHVFGHLRLYSDIVKTLTEENISCRSEGVTLYVDDSSERFAVAVARRSQDIFGDETLTLIRHTQ